MDTVRCNNMGINGPGMWKILHAIAVRAISDDSKIFFESFVETFKSLIHGKICADEFMIFSKNHDLSQYKNIIIDGIDIGYFKWTWELHNHVNMKLGKPYVSLTDAYKYYTTKKFDCKSCINIDI